MNRRYFNLGIAAFAAMLIIACHDGKSGHEEHEGEDLQENKADSHGDADEIHLTQAQTQACQLKVENVMAGDFTDVVEVGGRVLPASGAEVTVTATMAGIVGFANKTLTEGMAVNAGKALFVVNAKPIANGNPAAVAQSEAVLARQVYERTKKMFADRIVSQRELEEARQRYDAAVAASGSLGSGSQTRVIGSPIGGYIKNLLVKPGDYVSEGQAMATVTQSRRLQLRADVPERFYNVMSRISTANFRMAYDDKKRVYSMSELGGKLVSKGKASGMDDFFVPVVFEFDNTGDIVSGSFAEVFLKGSTRQGVISVPAEALSEQQGLLFVYVQTQADSFRRVEVKTGESDGKRIEILSGLNVGDKIVVHGVTQLRLAANASAIPEGHHH